MFYTEQIHNALNHLKLWSAIYDFPLHTPMHAQTDVIYSHNIDLITSLNHWSDCYIPKKIWKLCRTTHFLTLFILKTIIWGFKHIHKEAAVWSMENPDCCIVSSSAKEKRRCMPVSNLCIFPLAFDYILEQYTSMNHIIVTGLYEKPRSYAKAVNADNEHLLLLLKHSIPGWKKTFINIMYSLTLYPKITRPSKEITHSAKLTR